MLVVRWNSFGMESLLVVCLIVWIRTLDQACMIMELCFHEDLAILLIEKAVVREVNGVRISNTVNSEIFARLLFREFSISELLASS